MMKIKKLYIFIFFCCLTIPILLFPFGLVFYNSFIPSYRPAVNNLVLELMNEPSILDVEIVFAEIKQRHWYVSLKILFIDGDSIIIRHHVERRGENKVIPIDVLRINDYRPLFFSINRKESILELGLEYWSFIIEEKLENTVDIIRNFNAIVQHVELWTNLSDFMHDEEIFVETRNRVITENLYTDSILFNMEEIILLKYLTTTDWAWSTRIRLHDTRLLLYESLAL